MIWSRYRFLLPLIAPEIDAISDLDLICIPCDQPDELRRS
jgi:hypothetical protein